MSMAASSSADDTVPIVRTDCSTPPMSARPPDASCWICRSWREMSAARGVERQQPRRIELDADLAVDAADTRDRADAAHREHALGDGVVDEPGQRFVVEAVRRDRVGQDRCAGQVDLRDHRVAQVARQVGADARHGVAHVVDRLLRRLLQPELDRDRHGAVLHLRVDVLDALQRRDRVLDLARDFGFHLRRRGAGQRCDDRHRRQIDVRELLDLHRLEADDADQRQHHEQQDGRDRIADRPRRNVDGHRSLYFWADLTGADAVSTTRTVSPSARKPPPVSTTRTDGRQSGNDLDAVTDVAGRLRPWTARPCCRR